MQADMLKGPSLPQKKKEKERKEKKMLQYLSSDQPEVRVEGISFELEV